MEMGMAWNEHCLRWGFRVETKKVGSADTGTGTSHHYCVACYLLAIITSLREELVCIPIGTLVSCLSVICCFSSSHSQILTRSVKLPPFPPNTSPVAPAVNSADTAVELAWETAISNGVL